MSGPTPITAHFRVSFLYTVNSFQHRSRAYCEAVTSGDPSGFDLVGNKTFVNAGLSAVVDAYFNLFKGGYNPAWATFDGVLLEQRSGTSFFPITTHATTVTPTGAGATAPSMAYCISGKDDGELALPFYSYESTLGLPNKYNSYAALSAGDKAVVNWFFHQAGTVLDTDAWNWRISRGSLPPKRWLAIVIDSNQKLRRLRRIA